MLEMAYSIKEWEYSSWEKLFIGKGMYILRVIILNHSK